jgi:hypothetical protein
VELQGALRVQQEEYEKLKDEIKTLKAVMGRQERAIDQSKNIDSDYAAKLQALLGDLQVISHAYNICHVCVCVCVYALINKNKIT